MCKYQASWEACARARVRHSLSFLRVAAHVQWLLLATANPAVVSVMAVVAARRWLFPSVQLNLLLVVLEVLLVTALACVCP